MKAISLYFVKCRKMYVKTTFYSSIWNFKVDSNKAPNLFLDLAWDREGQEAVPPTKVTNIFERILKCWKCDPLGN